MTINLFSIIILAALLAEYSLELTGNLLNLRALKTELPAALQGIYQPEQYRRSQEYVRVHTRFGLAAGGFSLAVLLAFWLSGGFDRFDGMVRSWGFIPLVNGLFYIGLLALAYGLLRLPFSLYGTFVIEARFGFNRTTPRTFWLDQMKGLALGLLLGGMLLAGILALFQYLGLYTWVYCWAAMVIFSFVMQYLAPVWIMPLFNKFTPMEAGELKEAILSYAQSVDFPVKNVFVMDGSRRSTRSNAFFTGIGRNKRIALFDTLIVQNSVPELIAVLAHEVGHYKKRHILQGTLMSILHTGLVLFLLSVFLESPGLYQAFNMQEQPIYTGLLFFGLLYTPLELVISILTQIISRRHEYAADRFAAETTGQSQNLIAALKKLASANLSNLTPHPFFIFLNYSHPPLLQRIGALNNLPQGKTG